MKNNNQPDNSIYLKSQDNKYRYALGTKGKNTLYCIGINPSTATPEKYDPTVKRVHKIAHKKGFDSFIILNIYPERATDPNKLPQNPDKSEHDNNVKAILSLLGDNSVVWAAWGNSITKRPWLNECRDLIFKEIQEKKKDISFVRMGDLTVKKQPRHPLYCPATEFEPFL